MVAAAFYILSFLFAVSMLVFLPKANKKINIIIDVMFSYVTILNVAALAAFLADVAGVFISLVSMGAIFTVIGIIMLAVVILKKEIQLFILSQLLNLKI